MLFQTLFLSTLPFLALARTDLSGCVSSTAISPAGASLVWYVPGTGELCDFLDCGGGRDAPTTTQPGCPLYSGTATYSPSYLPGWGPSGQSSMPTQTSMSKGPSVSGNATAMTTAAPTSVVTSVVGGAKNGTLSTSVSPSVVPSNAGAFVGVSAVVLGVAMLGSLAML